MQAFSADGAFVHAFDGSTQGVGGFNQPVGICISPLDDRIIVTEYGSRRVQIF